MIYYCVKSLRGDFVGATPEAVTQSFSDMLGNAPTMMLWMVIICLIGFAVCFMGLQNGIEKISKVMMSALPVSYTHLSVKYRSQSISLMSEILLWQCVSVPTS